MNRAAERPEDGRKTVLIVEDDPGTQRVLASGLATSLGTFDVLTANHGQEAVELIESRHVDVVVTDLAMPVMDGFALIGYLTNRGTTLPVVVLSALAPTTIAEGLDGYGGLTVLRKPTNYSEVARAVRDALDRHDLGLVAGIPLASVLQLVEAERRTCSMGVTSGRRHGRLHFESGRLINAFSDDFGAEGEAAAFDILTWTRTAIEFDRLPEGVRRTIDIPMQALLIEVARRQDEQSEREAKLTPPRPFAQGTNGAPVASEPESDRAALAPENADAGDAAQPPQGDEDALTDDLQFDELDEPFSLATDGALPAPEAHVPSDDATPAPAATPIDAPVAATPIDAPFAATAPAPATPAAVPAALPAATHDATPAAAPATAGTHGELAAAIERLTHRVQAADAALAAVAEEVDAFRAAQQRYDDAVRRQEERRRAVEAARRDVADLARQILERMDGLFDLFGADAPDGPLDPHPADTAPNA